MRFYVVVNGKPMGPLTPEDLKSMEIKPSTFVKIEGMDDYKQASEIPEVMQLLNIESPGTILQYFATLDVRLLAVFIDYFLITFGYAFVAVVVVLLSDSESFKLFISLSVLAVIPVLKLAYAGFAEASANQATFGKRWLGLKVYSTAGKRLTLKQSFIRNFAKLLSALTFGIGFVSGFLDKKQQCLHDKIAGTVVVKDRLI